MKERRVHPRFDVILPAAVTVDGKTVEANIFDISMGGMQLGCDQAAAAVIVPTPNQTVSPGLNLVARLDFECPNNYGRVRVECRLVVSRRVSSNEFRIGMEFTDFAGDADRSAFKAYIRERLEEVA